MTDSSSSSDYFLPEFDSSVREAFDDNSVSDNSVSDNSVSDNSVSDNSVSDGSVSRHIHDARLGRVIALEQLTEKYWNRLVGFARSKMTPHLKQIEDEDDIANRVLTEFFDGIGNGKYKGLSNRNQLWRMLAKMTVRRVIDHFDKFTAQKRGGGNVKHAGNFEKDVSSSIRGVPEISLNEIDPHLGAALKESYTNLFQSLDDPKDRKIVTWHLEGLSDKQIAWRLLFTSTKSVRNRLEKIFQRLRDDLNQ